MSRRDDIARELWWDFETAVEEVERLEQLAAARLSDVDALAADRDAWAERARASFWLAAWRGISHDVVAGIVGGPVLGRSADVLRRVHRHTRAALDRAGR